MEDYNTATLPHEKYINLEKWEMAEFRREYEAFIGRSGMFFLGRVRSRWCAFSGSSQGVVTWENSDIQFFRDSNEPIERRF